MINITGINVYNFPPFRLNLAEATLHRGADELQVRPKTFSVLSVLVQNHKKLVTKDNLMLTVWPDVIVEDQALKNCIRELRQILGDNPRAAEFIQTVHGRGYRFIAPVSGVDAAPVDDLQGDGSERQHILVDRDEALEQLNEFLSWAMTGERQLVFINGEAGIGKSALADTFFKQVLPDRGMLSGQGQCIERRGTVDAFMPFIDALVDACKTAGFDAFSLIERHAPNWYRRLPGHKTRVRSGMPGSRLAYNDNDGMLLEMAEALETITRNYPVLILLEDVQWCDSATLELLAFMARRRNAARFLVIATYRIEDVIGTDHPLPAVKQELLVHKRCAEINLPPLTINGIHRFLLRRFTPVDAASLDLRRLAVKIHGRTDGNPLFMTEFLQHLINKNYLVIEQENWRLKYDLDVAVNEIPADLKIFIDVLVNRLDPLPRHILEIASLVGPKFSARLITGLVNSGILEIEEICSQLAEREFMLAFDNEKILDDGSSVQRFRFIHNVHQETLANRMPPAERIRTLRAIGERIENLYADDTSEVNAELASLFERGKMYDKAIQYFLLNARQLSDRGAEREARSQFARGSELLNLVRERNVQQGLVEKFRTTREKLYGNKPART